MRCHRLQDRSPAHALVWRGPEGRRAKLRLGTAPRQTEQVQSTPARVLELLYSHPIVAKRVEAIRLFNQCETRCRGQPDRSSPSFLTVPCCT